MSPLVWMSLPGILPLSGAIAGPENLALSGAIALPGASLPLAWLSVLGRASLEGGALAFGAWLVTAAFPKLPAFARTLLWWAVCVRLLVACVPNAALPIAVGPAALRVATVAPAREALERAGLPAAAAPFNAVAAQLGAAVHAANAPAAGSHRVEIALWILFALWAMGACARIVGWAIEASRLERLWRRARPYEGTAWHDGAEASQAPRVTVRIGEGFSAPLLLGGAGGRILLPESFAALPHDDQRAGIAHELAHLRRHDLLLGSLVALAECVFWFHPLVALAAREYAAAREEACDADAVRCSRTAPDRYAELLLRFGLEPHAPRSVAAGCGSRHLRQLKKRIVMLETLSSRSPARRIGAALLVAAAVAVLLPLKFVAPATAAAPDSPRRPASLHGQTTIVSPDDETKSKRAIDTRDFSFGRERNGDWFFWGRFESNLLSQLKQMQRTAGNHDVFWFRDGLRQYLVHDAASIAKLSELIAPMEAISAEQGRVGERQGAIGEQQGSLGERQARLGMREAEIDAKMRTVEGKLEELAATRRASPDLERQQKALETEIEKIAAELRDLEGEMDVLDAKQERLSAEQDQLSKRSELEMDRAAVAVREYLRPLIASGVAEPLRR